MRQGPALWPKKTPATPRFHTNPKPKKTPSSTPAGPEDGETLATLGSARRCFSRKHAHPAKVCYQMNKSTGGTTYGSGYGTGCADGAKPAQDAGLRGAGSEKWCCWEIAEGKAAEWKPPKWLKAVGLKQWCTGAVLAV